LIAQAIALNPKDAAYHGNLGNALRNGGKLDAAIAAQRRALTLRPDFPDAHCNLGNALKDKGELEEAIRCYRRAIAIEPDFVDAHVNLSQALLEQGNLSEADASARRGARWRSVPRVWKPAPSSPRRSRTKVGRATPSLPCETRFVSIPNPPPRTSISATRERPRPSRRSRRRLRESRRVAPLPPFAGEGRGEGVVSCHDPHPARKPVERRASPTLGGAPEAAPDGMRFLRSAPSRARTNEPF
jgi:hypothetical protein